MATSDVAVNSQPSKPGFKTTEFWLTLLAMLLGTLLTSGAFADGGLAAQIVGGAISILGYGGYTASRTAVKRSANALEATKHIAAAKDMSGLLGIPVGPTPPAVGLTK